ncbi:hypothetical protein [Photobacterium sp. GB-3]|uniref:hypothetical protein n=1 Tax=Photobacterium sp. GB-3 TaxID=2022110 RepID=UPI000D15AC95|nr:hypothetical protein [Photobacterium sp. GB-3]PSV57391.1 hypothetical protein C9J43_07335 [Photobacterium sp. GB-3]
MANFNNWDVSFPTIKFVETTLNGHEKVVSFERKRDIVFEVTREQGDKVTMVLVNEYILGLAAIYQIREEFPEADIIVTSGNWNGYTREAKEHGDNNDLGIFNIGEFFGALYWSNPKVYVKKDREGRPVYAYKTA